MRRSLWVLGVMAFVVLVGGCRGQTTDVRPVASAFPCLLFSLHHPRQWACAARVNP